MVSVSGITKQKMEEINNGSIVASEISSDNLYLINRKNEKFIAGNVKGVKGSSGLDTKVANYTSTVVTSFATSTWTNVTGWTFVEGLSTLFTYASDGTFTATQAGTYLFYFSATYSANATGRRIVSIWKNGAEVRRVDIGSSSIFTFEVSHICPLAIGNTLWFRVYHTAGVNLALGASPGHDISFVKVK